MPISSQANAGVIHRTKWHPPEVISYIDGVMERLKRKLSGWNRQYLSLCGRLILHLFTVFQCWSPRGLENFLRDFLWGGLVYERRLSTILLIEIQCVDQFETCMGVRIFEIFNKALLGRFKFWRRVVLTKYGTS